MFTQFIQNEVGFLNNSIASQSLVNMHQYTGFTTHGAICPDGGSQQPLFPEAIIDLSHAMWVAHKGSNAQV
jgi:hypothetical protein